MRFCWQRRERGITQTSGDSDNEDDDDDDDNNDQGDPEEDRGKHA